jgi:molybdopterin/thiamine biosynthesis adenylyltransferase
VTVTDDDVIEKSNLSRQFLFRNWHIGRCARGALRGVGGGAPPGRLCPGAAAGSWRRRQRACRRVLLLRNPAPAPLPPRPCTPSSKSTIAAEAAQKLNPGIHINALQVGGGRGGRAAAAAGPGAGRSKGARRAGG